MSFDGKEFRNTPLPRTMDWRRTYLVLVTGTMPNTCGHIILYVGGGFGHYFHFNGPSPIEYPRYMSGQGEYQRFLKEQGKRELLRKHVGIPFQFKAAAKLYELMNGKWATLLVDHNCATFAGQVIRAGGNQITIPEQCPVLQMLDLVFWEKIFGPLREKLGTEKSYQANH